MVIFRPKDLEAKRSVPCVSPPRPLFMRVLPRHDVSFRLEGVFSLLLSFVSATRPNRTNVAGVHFFPCVFIVPTTTAAPPASAAAPAAAVAFFVKPAASFVGEECLPSSDFFYPLTSAPKRPCPPICLSLYKEQDRSAGRGKCDASHGVRVAGALPPFHGPSDDAFAEPDAPL